MKYLAAFFCFLLVLYGGIYWYNNDIYGTWVLTKTGDIAPFEGNLKIAVVKSKPGSKNEFFTVIYNHKRQAFSCAPLFETTGLKPGYDYFLCIPVILNTENVKFADRFDHIVESSMMDEPLFLKLKQQAHWNGWQLRLEILPLRESDSGAVEAETNQYKNIGTYHKSLI